MSFVNLDNLFGQLIQIILNISLILSILHSHSHNLFLIVSFKIPLNLFQNLFMACMHQNPFVSILSLLLLQHGQSVSIPILYRSKSLSSLLILLQHFFLIVTSLLNLLLLFQFYNYSITSLNINVHFFNIVFLLDLKLHRDSSLKLFLLFFQLTLSPLQIKLILTFNIFVNC